MGVVLIIKRFNAVHGNEMRLSVYSHQCVGVFAESALLILNGWIFGRASDSKPVATL